LIRAKVFPRFVWEAGVYLNCKERQDVCPLGKVFSIRNTPRELTA
jgi:hypothetical protein